MVGTGLYLDDIEATIAQLDREAAHQIGTTLLWIAGAAAFGIAVITASGLWLNVSELRVADAKLKLLARQVVQSQEDERAHLARELHDGTSQTLVSAKLLVESAVDELERQGRPVPAAMGKALARLNESLTEVRRLSHRLRPAMLDTLGLPAALELLGREFGEHGGVQVAVVVDGEPRALPQDVTTALFRVAQEALVNIARHAGATHASLRLRFDAAGVLLLIEDDGRGFDVQAVNLDPQRGLGLRHMRERLAAIGGRFEVRTGPGKGTALSAAVPLAALQAAA
jgi:two-component system NarL family sensor kinase